VENFPEDDGEYAFRPLDILRRSLLWWTTAA
jgi:hypothetical protein